MKYLLICNGYKSHISTKTIAFYIQYDIKLLFIPPYSLYLCQLLNISVFNLLKYAMTNEIDNIMWYGIPTIKKFKWLNTYRNAHLKAFTPLNIKSRSFNTGLIPFNRHCVIVHLPNTSSELNLSLLSLNKSTKLSSCPFINVAKTLLKLNSASLKVANATLIQKINTSNLDISTKQYIVYLASLSKNL